MTDLSRNLRKKRWYCYLKSFLCDEMLEDIAAQYNDELSEALAKVINVIEFCHREEIQLAPEMAAGVLFGILAECASVRGAPHYDDLMSVGCMLARDTGW